ncbi:MAG TPA: hypothetical protein DCE55_24725 [Planctomycetaceae bacterium]|nr:hypothetical protein [Planctomycetaceae bacterium]
MRQAWSGSNTLTGGRVNKIPTGCLRTIDPKLYENALRQLLLSWIRQGAANESPRELERVETTPHQQVAQLGQPVSLRSTAYYSGNTKRDVTKWPAILNFTF